MNECETRVPTTLGVCTTKSEGVQACMHADTHLGFLFLNMGFFFIFLRQLVATISKCVARKMATLEK